MKSVKSLLGDSAVYGLAYGVAQLTPLLLTPIYAHMFLPSELGAATIANTLLALIGTIVVLALDNSAHRYFWLDDSRADRSRTINSWTWFYLFSAILIAALLAVMAMLTGGTPELPSSILLLIAGILPLRVLPQVLNNWLRMQRRPWPVLWFGVATFFLTCGLTLLFVVFWQRGVAGIFEAQLAAWMLLTPLSAWMMRGVLVPADFDLKRLRGMLSYALPLLPAGLLSWLMNLGDRWYLGARFDLTAVGVFQIAGTISLLLGVGVMAFQQAWGPYAFSIAKLPEAARVYSRIMLLVTICFSAGALLIVGCSTELVWLVGTDAYLGATELILPLAFAQVPLALYYVGAIGCNLAMRNGAIAWSLWIGAATKILMTFLLSHYFGIAGVAWATLLAQFAMTVAIFVGAQRVHPVPYPFALALLSLLVFLSVAIALASILPPASVETVTVKVLLLTVAGCCVWRFRFRLMTWMNVPWL